MAASGGPSGAGSAQAAAPSRASRGGRRSGRQRSGGNGAQSGGANENVLEELAIVDASPTDAGAKMLSPIGTNAHDDGGEDGTSPSSDKTLKHTDNAVTVRLQKTKMCYFFEKGKCASQSCRYAHSASELRTQPNLQKTKLCRKFALDGACADGENCVFAHGEADLRVTEGIYKTQMCHFYERGRCLKGDRCNHAHGTEDMRIQTDLQKAQLQQPQSQQQSQLQLTQPPQRQSHIAAASPAGFLGLGWEASASLVGSGGAIPSNGFGAVGNAAAVGGLPSVGRPMPGSVTAHLPPLQWEGFSVSDPGLGLGARGRSPLAPLPLAELLLADLGNANMGGHAPMMPMGIGGYPHLSPSSMPSPYYPHWGSPGSFGSYAPTPDSQHIAHANAMASSQVAMASSTAFAAAVQRGFPGLPPPTPPPPPVHGVPAPNPSVWGSMAPWAQTSTAATLGAVGAATASRSRTGGHSHLAAPGTPGPASHHQVDHFLSPGADTPFAPAGFVGLPTPSPSPGIRHTPALIGRPSGGGKDLGGMFSDDFGPLAACDLEKRLASLDVAVEDLAAEAREFTASASTATATAASVLCSSPATAPSIGCHAAALAEVEGGRPGQGMAITDSRIVHRI